MTGWGFGPPGQHYRGHEPVDDMRAAVQRVMRDNAPAALAADLRACDAYESGVRAAAALDCPVQVIVGGHDRMAPQRATDALIEALPRPEAHRIAEAGHMIPVETPDRCRRILADFIFRRHPADTA